MAEIHVHGTKNGRGPQYRAPGGQPFRQCILHQPAEQDFLKKRRNSGNRNEQHHRVERGVGQRRKHLAQRFLHLDVGDDIIGVYMVEGEAKGDKADGQTDGLHQAQPAPAHQPYPGGAILLAQMQPEKAQQHET